jgi:hypothetical protein
MGVLPVFFAASFQAPHYTVWRRAPNRRRKDTRRPVFGCGAALAGVKCRQQGSREERHGQSPHVFRHAGRCRRGAGRHVRAGHERAVGLLLRRRHGAHPLRCGPRCRHAGEARLGQDAGRHSIRLAASLAEISLRCVEHRRPGLFRQRAQPGGVSGRRRRRARAARGHDQAALAADSHQRRPERRIRAGGLQFPLGHQRSPDQGRRQRRRRGGAAGQPGKRHLLPPGPRHPREQDPAGGRARQQSGGWQGRGSRLAARLRIQERCPLELAKDPAQRRLRLRAAPPRYRSSVRTG